MMYLLLTNQLQRSFTRVWWSNRSLNCGGTVPKVWKNVPIKFLNGWIQHRLHHHPNVFNNLPFDLYCQILYNHGNAPFIRWELNSQEKNKIKWDWHFINKESQSRICLDSRNRARWQGKSLSAIRRRQQRIGQCFSFCEQDWIFRPENTVATTTTIQILYCSIGLYFGRFLGGPQQDSRGIE